MFTDLPVDVIQHIALMNDPKDYLNIALVCKHCSGILSNTKEHPRRAKAIRHFTRMTNNKFRIKEWRLNGRLHRDNDKPARIYSDGIKDWFVHGKRHRDNDKPAIIWQNVTKEWYQNGLRHRDNDKPARIWADGTKAWWKYGLLIKSE